MTTLKSAQTKASASDFIDQISDPQKKADSITLDKLYQKITGQKPKMWGATMIGYGSYTYSRSNKQEFEYFAGGFSPRKQVMTVYLMSHHEDFEKEFDRLGKFKKGMGCLYINKLADIDIKILEDLITRAYKSLNAKHVDYSKSQK